MTFCTKCGKRLEGSSSTNGAICPACLQSFAHPPSSRDTPWATSPLSHSVSTETSLAGDNRPSNEFDPYYTWLGIPPARQPPNHYQLLGVMDFEQNADVISNAADRQMSHLRSYAAGQHSRLSQTLLNEVASARVCLLNAAAKEAYDQQLHDSRSSIQASTIPVPVPSPTYAPSALSPAPVSYEAPPMMLASGVNASLSEPTTSPSAPYIPKRRSFRAPNKSVRQAISIVIGGLMGCAIGWFIIFVFLPKLEEREAQRQRSGRVKNVALAPQAPQAIPPLDRSPPQVSHPTLKSLPRRNLGSAPDRTEQPSHSPFEIEPPPPPSEILPDESIPSSTATMLATNGMKSSIQPATVANSILSAKTAVPEFVSLPETSSLLSTPIASFPERRADIDLRVLDAAATTTETETGKPLLVEETSESETRVWTVSIASDQDSEANPPRAIAEFLLAGGELSFKWFSSAGPREQALIQNCAIGLSVGSEPHTIAMRQPQLVQSLVFDMENQRETHQFAVANRPNPDRLILELGDLKGFPAKARYKNDKQDVTVGKTAVIEFEGMPGAELEFRFIALGSDSVGIAVSPAFREDAASRVAMTKSQLEKTLISVQGTIARTQSEIIERKAEATRLERLSTSQMSRPQIISLQGKISQIRQQINSYQGRLRQLQATLAAVPNMRNFIESLHGNVRLNFKVKMDVGEQQQIALIAGANVADP